MSSEVKRGLFKVTMCRHKRGRGDVEEFQDFEDNKAEVMNEVKASKSEDEEQLKKELNEIVDGDSLLENK